MNIAELIHDLPCSLVSGAAEREVTGITEDSRTAVSGSLFVARPGTAADGRAFIGAAVAAGAVAVLCDGAEPIEGVAILEADDVPAAGSALAERFHGDPSRMLTLIGITGTNGKTTTAHLIQSLLRHDDRRCGLIGTVHVDDGVARRPARLTTPSPIEISGLLADMVARECTACVMEVSSHALDQRRTDGLAFRGGVFTNISGDHLDYHGTMENYVEAKARLFEALPSEGFAVINADDLAARRMVAGCDAEVLACSLRDPSAPCTARVVASRIGRVEVVLRGPWGQLDLELPLTGAHNVANAIEAAAVAYMLGVPTTRIATGLSHCPAPPGRLEPVDTGALGYDVLVDYAHTDDALENVLSALREVMAEREERVGKLRVVFGCGGDRDRTKRPRMAEAACRYADDVIITSDNPRTEDPGSIVDEVFRGVPDDRRGTTARLVDRAEAIRAAVERSAPGDVVLIAGKGHEDYQIVGTTRRPFDDSRVAAAVIAERREQVGSA